jgi:hypothetical protein
MESIILQLLSEYLLEQNNIVLLTNLCEVSYETKMYLFLHNIYKKKKSAYLLQKVVKSLELSRTVIQETNTSVILETFEDKRTFKYILNAFYNASNTNYDYVDVSIKTYKHSVFDYREDRLNPFRRLKLYKKQEFKKRMQNNMTLNLALMHAEMPYYFAKANEISEY